MSGQRCRFTAYTFHQVAIAAQRIDVVVENLKLGTVEIRRLPAGGNRHSHAVAHSLSQRAGRGFKSRRDVRFGMPGSTAAQLAEALEFFHGHRELF